MEQSTALQSKKPATHTALPGIIAVVLVLCFAGLVVISDHFWLPWMKQVFPNAVPNLWGLVSRGHMLLLGIMFVAVSRDPRLFGFQIGKTYSSWRLILTLLVFNCGIVGAYLAFSGSTPYSGNQWLLTEVVWVPLIEELIWRGVVFTLLVSGLQKCYPKRGSAVLAIAISGLVFGLLHGNNIFYGVPPAFVAIQVLNAAIWGVVYAFARARTESIYPPMLLHAAMNLMVVFF